MSQEQAPVAKDAERLYTNHKIDVEAARQLGGLAFVGSPEPGAELSQRSQWLLDRADGDVSKAAAEGKHTIEKNAESYGRDVSENLDRYIEQARADMAKDKPEPPPRPRPLRQMEAAIDPRTGQTVLPPEHYTGHRSRYYDENDSRYNPNH